MNRNTDELDRILDGAVSEIRDGVMDPDTERGAADRVWARIREEALAAERLPDESHRIGDCGDFQALIPAYLRDGLNEPKRMLLEDHLTECVPCRRALKEARSARRRGVAAPSAAARSDAKFGVWTWRLAAAAVLVLAFVGLNVKTDVFTLETGGLVRIESIEGEAFRVGSAETVRLQPGDEVDFRDARLIRTGKNSGLLLRLEDESQVEMNERAELSVLERRKLWQRARGDSVVDLGRGSVIVEASDQGSGHLFVDTADAVVAVTGTVFAVNHGIAGSRVSVIEGEVHVRHGGAEDVLLAGGQAVTSTAIGHVPVETEIAWSRQLDKHLALLAEFSRLSREIDAAVAAPDLRYESDLLDLVQQQTAVYVSIPNLTATLDQAYDLLRQRVDSNELLRSWWDETVVGSGADSELELAMNRIRDYGGRLGKEIVVTVGVPPYDGGNGVASLLVVARVNDEPALRTLIERDLASANQPVVLLGEGSPQASALDGVNDPMMIWIGDGHLALSSNFDELNRFAALAASGARGEFAASAFRSRLAAVYSGGVEWVVAVDVQRLRDAAGAEENESLAGLGVLDLQHVIAHRSHRGGIGENRAELSFDGPRRGVASWLAAPAPMGSLDFVSPDAYFAAAFVVKEPLQAVDELFGVLGSANEGFAGALSEFETTHGIDLRRDVAAAVGGEFVFAIDGPLLPKPSWKLVMEVYDPQRLQATLTRMVAHLDDIAGQSGLNGFELSEEPRAGRVYHALRSIDTGITAHYVFEDGYLIAAASPTLIDRALQFRDSGLSIAHSPRLSALLPQNARVHFSGMVYQNIGDLFGPLAGSLARGAQRMSAEQEGLLHELATASGPNLTLLYGESDSITVVNTAEGGLLRYGLRSILSLQSLLSVRELLGEAAREQAEGAAGDESSEVDVRVERHAVEG